MQLTVRLFALARQRLGLPELTVELPESATVGDLRRSLGETIPELATMLPSLLVAVNSEYARDGDSIPPGAEVALIPPVSGGGLCP